MLQAWLVGSKAAAKRHLVDGGRESRSLPRVVQWQDVDHGVSGSTEAP